jgi:hypothetical protein
MELQMSTRNPNGPMVITLTPELERSLTEQARKRGTTPEILALDSLRERFIPPDEPAGDEGTLAEFLGDHIGVLHRGRGARHADRH